MTRQARTKRQLQPPDLPGQLAVRLIPPELVPGARLEELALEGWHVSGAQAEDVVWEQLSLERAGLAGTVLRRLLARDVRLRGCDLANADWSYATLERVELLQGRLTGLRLIEAKLGDVRWVDCKLDMAQFRFARLRDARFEACPLLDADFQGATLDGVAFPGCDLQGANFTGARLAGVDFRGARLAGAIFRGEDLKGAIIDGGQAIELAGTFARCLGVSVRED